MYFSNSSKSIWQLLSATTYSLTIILENLHVSSCNSRKDILRWDDWINFNTIIPISQLAFYVNLHWAVIGPSATLTGRWRPDIDLRRMLTGIWRIMKKKKYTCIYTCTWLSVRLWSCELRFSPTDLERELVSPVEYPLSGWLKTQPATFRPHRHSCLALKSTSAL